MINLLSYIKRIYDISTPISKEMAIYPGDVEPKVDVQQDYDNGGFRVSALGLGSHTGTHMDAPKHVFGDGMSIDELPLERLMGPVRVLEVSPGEITKRDLPDDLLPGDSIFLKTRRGEGETGNAYLSLEAAIYLSDSGIKTVGTDGLSIESDSGGGHIHKFLLSKSIIIIEGLRLEHIAPRDYFFICLPLKIKGCDGAPARALLFE